jgi:1-acyl-sn-glycerol-3-phosphate acyltransferase
VRRKPGENGSVQEPFVLPQWMIDVIRPVGRTLSKLLWRIKYSGLENVPQSGGFIIAANHQTYLDPFWIGFPISRPMRFLAWNKIFEWPVVGKFTGMFGAWPLEVEGSDPAAIRRALQWLKGGGGVVIFPEGGRGMPDGSMVRFKPGAVRMALEANVPILPVTIRGAHRVWPKTKKFPRFKRVEIIYHPLLQLEPQDGAETRAHARRASDHLTEIIGSAL